MQTRHPGLLAGRADSAREMRLGWESQPDCEVHVTVDKVRVSRDEAEVDVVPGKRVGVRGRGSPSHRNASHLVHWDDDGKARAC